jgi:hypothetical protein
MFAERAFYGILTQEGPSTELPGGAVDIYAATMLMRESAALVQAWPIRENRHLGYRPANEPSVTLRAARLV